MKNKIFIFLFFIPSFLFAQEYIYKEFGLNDGLPSIQVYDSYQDKHGIIWFATDRGIANYNGYEIKQFGVKDGLLSNVVLGFHPQPDGKVYCSAFDNSLFYFEEDFNGFRPYKYNHILSRYLPHAHTIKHILFDENYNLHVSCLYKNGKLVIDKNGKVKENKENLGIRYAICENSKRDLFYYLSYDIPSLNENIFSMPCTDWDIEFIKLPHSDNIIFKSVYEVSVLNKKGKIISTIKNKYRPISITAIDSTHFFIGYLFGGGSIADVKGNIIDTFLYDQSITDFLIDKEGGYWLTTLYSGVFYIKEPRIRTFDNKNVNNISIYSLTKDYNDEIIVSCDNGSTFKIDSENNTDIYFDSNNVVRSFFEYDMYSGNSLFCSYSKKKFFKNGKQIIYYSNLPYILKFSEPAEKGMLISQVGGMTLVDMIGTKPDQFIKFPFRVHDACYCENDIYLGTPQGIYAYTPEKKLIDLKKKSLLFSYRVDDIDYNKKRNELYFASLGGGLVIYSRDTGKISAISRKNGLLSDIVNEVHIENENEIWACTNSGLNRITFNPDGSYTLTGLKSSDGLLNDGISDVEIINDTVWIASKKGLVYAPEELFKAKNTTPNYFLRMKKVLVNEIETDIRLLSNLSYDQNRIEFNFEGVSFKSSGNLVYKYKLEGLDTKWYNTKNRKVTFTSLPYGKYIFKIAVESPAGIQAGKLLAIPVTIKAPYWKTGWFITLCIILTVAIIYFFFKLRVLTYNKDITRELLRILVKKIRTKENYFIFKESGKDIRVKTDTILYVKSAGNYIELITENKTHIVRCKIGDFIASTPDPLEYLRIHRSYIIRIDKVEAKSRTEVIIRGEKLAVSDSYAVELDKLFF